MDRRGQLESPVSMRVHDLDGEAVAVGEDTTGGKIKARGALPGEEVHVHVEHVGRDRAKYGVVTDVVCASPERVAHACPNYGACGGCDLLFASPQFQDAWKLAQLHQTLGCAETLIAPMLTAERFYYRHFAKFVVGADGLLGSYRPYSHDVVSMYACLVHAPVLETLRAKTTKHLPAHAQEVGLRYVLLRTARGADAAIVTLVVRDAGHPVVKILCNQLAEFSEVASVAVHQNADTGDALLGPGPVEVVHQKSELIETLNGLRFPLSAAAFSQINPQAAERLYACVVAEIQPKASKVLDLYAGSGGLGLSCLQAGAREVRCVEANPAGVAAIVAAVQHNVFDGSLKADACAVEAVLPVLAEGWDVILMNPPRKGLSSAVVEKLNTVRVPRLVYVSCQPKSLRRDLAMLTAGPWQLQKIVPVDLFPQTRHLETIAFLTPKT